MNGSRTLQDAKNEFLNNYLNEVPEQTPLTILDSKSAMGMDKYGNVTKHTRHITRIMHF